MIGFSYPKNYHNDTPLDPPMKSILTIGYQQFLFASETDASKCLSLIAQALPVRDRSYSGMIEILEATHDISMSIVSKPIRFVKEGSTDPVEMPQKNGAKKKGGAARLALTAQRKQPLLRLE